MKLYIQSFWRDTQGQDLVEYALVTGLVAVAVVAATPLLTTTFSTVYSKLTSIVPQTVP